MHIEHLCKDFLSDSEFFSEVSDVSWSSADGGLWGEIYASVSQLSLNQAYDFALRRAAERMK